MDRTHILLGIQALLAALVLTGTALESTYDSLITFWFPVIAFVCFSYYLVAQAEERWARNSILFVFIATISLSSVLLLPGFYMLDKDAHFEFQYASTIIENGYIKVSDGLGFAKDYYGNNPPLHLIISGLSLLTDLPAFTITKYLMQVLIKMLTALIAFLIFKDACRKFKIDDTYAYLGAIMFCVSYGTLGLGISRRSIAIVYLLLLIHITLRQMERTKKIFLTLSFSALVVLSDHSLAYMLIFSSFGLFAFYTFLLRRRGQSSDEMSIAILGHAVFCLAVFVLSRGDALYLYVNEYNYVREFIENILFQKAVTAQEAAAAATERLDPTHYLIKSVITIISQVVFFVLAIPGGRMFYRKIRSFPESERINGNVLIALLLAVFISFPVMVCLLRTSVAVYTQPFMWLPYMVLSICFVYTLEGLPKWTQSPLPILCIIALMVMGNFLLSYPTSVLASKDQSKISLEDYRAKTDELYYSGQWVREQAGERYVLVDGDPTVFDIYGPFFGIEVTGEWWINSFYSANDSEYNRLLLENRTVYTKMRGNYPQRADYIITNRLVYTYQSGYLNDNRKFHGLDRFDNSSSLDSIYDNGQIQVRRIDYASEA
jgi:uncharacterized membrane protein